ncbi:hypothetical protein ABZP36_027041 [Zizania latifolia]
MDPSSAAAGGAPAVAAPQPPAQLSRYESQKRRDWNTFLQYLRNHRPPLTLARCSGAHVIEFLRYLDQFGKTKVHAAGCAFYGQSTRLLRQLLAGTGAAVAPLQLLPPLKLEEVLALHQAPPDLISIVDLQTLSINLFIASDIARFELPGFDMF